MEATLFQKNTADQQGPIWKACLCRNASHLGGKVGKVSLFKVFMEVESDPILSVLFDGLIFGGSKCLGDHFSIHQVVFPTIFFRFCHEKTLFQHLGWLERWWNKPCPCSDSCGAAVRWEIPCRKITSFRCPEHEHVGNLKVDTRMAGALTLMNLGESLEKVQETVLVRRGT